MVFKYLPHVVVEVNGGKVYIGCQAVDVVECFPLISIDLHHSQNGRRFTSSWCARICSSSFLIWASKIAVVRKNKMWQINYISPAKKIRRNCQSPSKDFFKMWTKISDLNIFFFLVGDILGCDISVTLETVLWNWLTNCRRQFLASCRPNYDRWRLEQANQGPIQQKGENL